MPATSMKPGNLVPLVSDEVVAIDRPPFDAALAHDVEDLLRDLFARVIDVGDERAATADVLVQDAEDADELDVVAHQRAVAMKRQDNPRPSRTSPSSFFDASILSTPPLPTIVLDERAEVAQVRLGLGEADGLFLNASHSMT